MGHVQGGGASKNLNSYKGRLTTARVSPGNKPRPGRGTSKNFISCKGRCTMARVSPGNKPLPGKGASKRHHLRQGSFVGLAETEEGPLFQGMQLNRQQKRLEQWLCKQLAVAKRGRLAANEQEWDAVVEEAHQHARPYFVSGPPGTGKTTVVDKCVRKCLRDGGRVLYALPTAQQASRVRTKHPQADVDTCSGAFFLYREAVEVMDCLTQYDMVAVDEISQLSQKDFERIIQMWEAADKVPVLVFAGDFWQLPGVSPTKPTDGPRWNMVHQIDFHEMWRCKDEVLRAKLHLLRTSTPTKRQLRDICSGHKAWSGRLGSPAAVPQPSQHHHSNLHAKGSRRGK